MRQKSNWLGMTALVAPLALAVALSGWSGLGLVHGQTATAPATQPGGLAYSTEARPEILKLKAAPANPKTADDLRAVQERVEAVVRQAMPATVGLIMPDGQGSGVIVSKDGYVLTAGHVSGKAGDRLVVVLSNGSQVQGHSLGANNNIDSGMVKIDTPAVYPFMPLGTTSTLSAGQWVIAMGHPGGYQETRPPVVRLGRVLSLTHSRGTKEVTAVATDCTLINGDSGGPVFDLDGRVVGINSRIGRDVTQNIHVPVDTFISTWADLANGTVWGGRGGLFARGGGGPGGGANGGGPGRGGPAGRGGNGGPGAAAPAPAPVPTASPRLGFKYDDDEKGPVITYIAPGTPADSVDLRTGDIITKFDGKTIKSGDELKELLANRKPGDTVTLDLLRGNAMKRVPMKVGSD